MHFTFLRFTFKTYKGANVTQAAIVRLEAHSELKLHATYGKPNSQGHPYLAFSCLDGGVFSWIQVNSFIIMRLLTEGCEVTMKVDSGSNTLFIEC